MNPPTARSTSVPASTTSSSRWSPWTPPIARLAAEGIDAEAPGSPDGSDHFRTTWITDPDGHRIELVQWPAGHPDGITAADWTD